MEIRSNMTWFNYLILIHIVLSSASSSASDNNNKPPDISMLVWIGSELYSSSGDHLKTQVSHELDQEAPVTVVNQTTYILTAEVTLIGFMCKASYPVEWEFLNSKWFLLQDKTFGAYVTTSRRISDDLNIDDTQSFSYWSELAVLGDSRMYIGAYLCKSSDERKSSKSSNITLFWEGGPFDRVFVLSGKNITIYIEKDDSVIFPCQVNNPFANVTLKREDRILSRTQNLTDNWVPVVLQNPGKWTYRPETGFIFRGISGRLDDYPESGNYKCILEDDENQDQNEDSEDAVYMSFYLGVENDIQLDTPIKTNATMIYNQNEHRYECCSNSATPPNIMIHSCCDPATCKELIPAMKTQQSSMISSSQTISSSSVNQFVHPQLSDMFNRKNGSCLYRTAWSAQAEMDMVQCIGDGINVVRKYFPRNSQNLSVDQWDHDHLQKWVGITPLRWRNPSFPVKLVPNKTDTYQVYSGTSVTFSCQTSFYFFSYGIRFSTRNNADNKMHVLPDTFETETRRRYPQFQQTLLIHSPPLTANVNVTITPDIKSLTCHAPVIYSSSWVEQTIYFSVKAGEKPSILSSDNGDVIVWTLNATGKSLICKAKGDPEPRVIWTKDNVPVTSNFNKTRHADGSFILYMPKVTHDIQGKYSCIAMNFKGQSEKIFTVYAEEMGTSHVAAIIIITILILIITIGVGILVRRTILQRKSLDNLREHPQQEGLQQSSSSDAA